MGNYWLHAAETPLKTALGAKFKLYPGYRTNCRSSGGFNDIRGIVMHHDADSTEGLDDSVISYEYERASVSPIGNFHVQRDGDVWYGAAGASNHAGKGGPVSTSKGTVPLDQGNLYLIGIEASNNGVGEVWGTAIMDSYLVLVTVLCKTFRLDPLKDIYGHWTYCEPSCPGRKIDPRGPTPKYPKFGGTSGTNKWNMQEVRKEVNARLGTTVIPTPPPTTTPTTPPAPSSTGGMNKMLIMKYGGTATSGWSGWFSNDGGASRKPVSSMAHANTLVDLGALDAKTRSKVTNRNWDGVSHTTSTATLDQYLTPYG